MRIMSVSGLSLSLACGLPLLVAAPTARGQCQVTETGQCVATDGAGGDSFGYDVSINGDVAIIGARDDDEDGAQSGSAYIHRFDGTNWVEEAKLTACDGAASDNFGTSVAISGDVAVVGAPNDDHAAFFAGSVYIFRFNGVVWIEEAKLTASDAGPIHQFGWSVATTGGVALIGAYGDDHAGSLSGSAYVFRFSEGLWIEEAKLVASDAAQQDEFGISVSLSGNVAIVGASTDPFGPASFGSAYIFRFDGNAWPQKAKLTASDEAAGDEYGGAVAIDSDVAIVGARHNADAGISTGSAYVYRFDGANWPEEEKLLPADAAAGDKFGTSVAVSGNVAVVSATAADDSAADSGAAYVLEFDGSTWVEKGKLLGSNIGAFQNFGLSVSTDGNRAIIGAIGADGIVSGSGSAYVFDSLPNVCNSCPWDLSGNMSVDVPDLLGLLAAWGTDPGGPPDFDGDANVAVPDLLALLAHWGPCP